jgi:hypothetical protein
MKPTEADIINAIDSAEATTWIDPLHEPIFWYAELFAPSAGNHQVAGQEVYIESP